jgi:hypothetical protein
MSFVFNATRWILNKEVRFVIPLWNMPLGRLIKIETSANEITLRFRLHNEVTPTGLHLQRQSPCASNTPYNTIAEKSNQILV